METVSEVVPVVYDVKICVDEVSIFPFVTGFHWTWKELQADSDLIEDEE